MPSVRSRFVGGEVALDVAQVEVADSAVSSWTITSGSASATRRATASGSSASATTGRAPRLAQAVRLDSLRVMPVDLVPARHELGDERLAERAGCACDEDLHDGSFLVCLTPLTRQPGAL